jgi:hypothetical protein
VRVGDIGPDLRGAGPQAGAARSRIFIRSINPISAARALPSETEGRSPPVSEAAEGIEPTETRALQATNGSGARAIA